MDALPGLEIFLELRCNFFCKLGPNFLLFCWNCRERGWLKGWCFPASRGREGASGNGNNCFSNQWWDWSWCLQQPLWLLCNGWAFECTPQSFCLFHWFSSHGWLEIYNVHLRIFNSSKVSVTLHAKTAILCTSLDHCTLVLESLFYISTVQVIMLKKLAMQFTWSNDHNWSI